MGYGGGRGVAEIAGIAVIARDRVIAVILPQPANTGRGPGDPGDRKKQNLTTDEH